MVEASISSTSTNRFLGISGGGWNSHSIASGLISGSLAGLSKQINKSVDLKTFTGDIDGLSANSGGSWFLSQIAYSSVFRVALESESGRNNWNSTGYNGQVAILFIGVTKESVDTIKSIKSLIPKRLYQKAS
jgi:hypothetical protein